MTPEIQITLRYSPLLVHFKTNSTFSKVRVNICIAHSIYSLLMEVVLKKIDDT